MYTSLRRGIDLLAGILIAVEGIDGAGKTEQVRAVADNLRQQDFQVCTMHFPSKGTYIGNEIYAFLNGERDYSHRTVELLQGADKHAQQEEIRAALCMNDYVILDRYSLTQKAYSDVFYSRGSFSADETELILTGIIQPDYGILLDVSADEAARRMKGKNLDVYEADVIYLEQVRGAFLRLGKAEGYCVIDGMRPKQEIYEDILDIILA